MAPDSAPPHDLTTLYRNYVLLWGGIWLLTLFLFYLPQESDILDTVPASWAIPNFLFCSCLEVVFAVFWASLSYLLFQAGQRLLRLRVDSAKRRAVIATFLLALLELCLISAPLFALTRAVSRSFSRAPFHHDAVMEPVIRQSSYDWESVGILLAFPLACLGTGISFAWQHRNEA